METDLTPFAALVVLVIAALLVWALSYFDKFEKGKDETPDPEDRP